VLPPTVTGLNPTHAPVGTPSLSLSVSGNNFAAGDQVKFNGIGVPTSGNSSPLTATLGSARLGTVDSFPVTVCDGSNNCGTANTNNTFTVDPINLASLNPTSALAGSAPFPLTITGSGFIDTSITSVHWNSTVITPNSVTSTQIGINSIDLAALGTNTGGAPPVNVTVCNGTACSSPLPFTVASKPIPNISNIAPHSATEGDPATPIAITGTNFTPGNSVDFLLWNGTPKSMNCASTISCTYTIPASDLAVGKNGTVQVQVQDTSAGGETSTPALFTINTLTGPSITSINPQGAVVGSGPIALTVTGTNYLASSQIMWDGSPINTNASQFASGTLTASLSNTDLGSVAHVFHVTVCNGNNCSVAPGATFTVTTKPPPTITSINPNSATAGDPATLMLITGTGFTVGASVDYLLWNGAPRVLNCTSTTSCFYTIPAADLATAGTEQVQVEDTSSGGGTSTPATLFTINPQPIPTITLMTPNTKPMGSAPFFLGITGSGFINGTSIIKWDTIPLPTTFIDSTDLAPSINIDLGALGDTSPKSVNVTVCNGATCSIPAIFNVTLKPVPSINQLTDPTPGLVPSSVVEGAGQFNLAINGSNFSGSDIVNFSGHQIVPNSGGTSTQLVAIIQAAWVAVGTGGTTIPVTVQDISSGGNTSNTVYFAVTTKPIPPDHAPLSIQVDNSVAATTDTGFTVNIRVNPSDNPLPSFANVSFQYNDDQTGLPVISSYTNTTALQINGSGVLSIVVFPPIAKPGNRHYYNIQAKVSTFGSQTDPSWSPYTPSSLPSNIDAWTLPTAPGSGYATASAFYTSITATILFPNTNSQQTFYKLQMVKDPASFTTPSVSDPIHESNTVQFGQSPNVVRGLDPFTPYYIRTYVISNSPFGVSFDVASLPGIPILTGAPQVTGTIVAESSFSITASWNLNNFTNVSELQSGATNYAGGSAGISNVLISPFTSPIQITVNSITPSNTSYTLFLEDQSQGSSSFVTYPGSQVIGYTLAAQPGIPVVSFTGAAGSLVMNIGFNSLSDGNAPDTLYAIQVSSQGGPVSFLAGDGTVIVQPTAPAAAFRTMADWTSGKNIVNTGLVLDSTYTVLIGAKQADPKAAPAVAWSNTLSVLTPHMVPQGPNPPDPVTNFSAFQVSASRVIWTWVPPASNPQARLVLMDGVSNQPIADVTTSNLQGLTNVWMETGLSLGQTITRYMACSVSLPSPSTSYSNVATATTSSQAGTLTLDPSIFTSGILIDGQGYGVDTSNSKPVTVVFSAPVDPNSLILSGAVTLQQGTVASGGVQWGNPIPLSQTFYSQSFPTQITLQPANGHWVPNQLYKLTFSAQSPILSLAGDALAPVSVQFYTVPDASVSNTLSSVDANGLVTRFMIPANTFPQGGFPVTRDKFGPNTNALTLPGLAPAQVISAAGGLIPTATIRELMIYSNPGSLMTIFGNGAAPSVSIEYPNSTSQVARAAVGGSGLSSSLSSPSQAGLAIYMIDPQTRRTTAVAGSSLDSASNSVSAPLATPGIYFVAAPVQTDLGAAMAYPVPFKPSLGHTQIIFTNLAGGSTIKVYTIIGELVAQLQNSAGQSTLPWNVTNLDGAPVASGVYIYQIKNSFSEKRGKLMIIR